MEAVCGSAHYQIAAYWSRVLNKPAIKAYQASRRGIVLTANYTAKQKGVKTGQALWQAKSACPDLVVVPPRMELYLQFSSMLREIYGEYTDLVEPFGIDESWLDITGSMHLFGGDPKAMLASLDRLAALPGNYKVYPGHEGATELDYERRVNPFMTRRLSL